MFVAASDVTLYTGGLSQWVQPVISKDRATPLLNKILLYFNIL
jgi:hypothetical protein